MLFAHQYSHTRTVPAGNELTQGQLREFRARVGLALAASDRVVVDLTRIRRVDGWALLALSDLAGTFDKRLSFDAPDFLARVLIKLKT